MKKLLYVLTGLCLLAGVFAGCEKKPLDDTDGGAGGGATTQRGSIEGIVTDKNSGKPVLSAIVLLLPGGQQTQTDEKGAFSFSEVKVGSYTLQVTKSGYAGYTSDKFSVEADCTAHKIIELQEEQLGLQILDEDDNVIHGLHWNDPMTKGVFKLKNTGESILEWTIRISEAPHWIGTFNKENGTLAPGASEKIEFRIEEEYLSIGENESVIPIKSSVGDKQLRVVYSLKDRFYVERISDVELMMVEAKGGSFMMGATEEQLESSHNALPVHSVTLDGFYIGKFEVTQAQWKAVMGTSSYYKDDYPMNDISYTDAVRFCEKLSQKTGKKYRLPTEAEWEYAARGGQYHDGTKYAGSNNVEEVAWTPADFSGQSYSSCQPVGKKQPNGLGLYDMSGNVSEWCSDWSGDYSELPAVNPQGPTSGKYRIVRGGEYGVNSESCRVSRRSSLEPQASYIWLGFRVVREL